MKSKTILIILLTVIVTVFLMLNTDPVDFNFLFAEVSVSKLLVIGVCAAIGFIVGYLVGKPKTVVSTYDPHMEEPQNNKEPKDNLSQEDRDYIS